MCPRVFTLYVVLWSASLNKFVSDRSRYFPVNLNYSSDTEEDFSQHFGMLQWCHVINEAKWSKAQPKDSHRPVIVFYHRSFFSATRRKLDPFGSIFSPLPVHRERESVPMAAAQGDLHEFWQLQRIPVIHGWMISMSPVISRQCEVLFLSCTKWTWCQAVKYLAICLAEEIT